MLRSMSSPWPLTVALTRPPPAVPVTSASASACWAFMSCSCICCAAANSCCISIWGSTSASYAEPTTTPDQPSPVRLAGSVFDLADHLAAQLTLDQVHPGEFRSRRKPDRPQVRPGSSEGISSGGGSSWRRGAPDRAAAGGRPGGRSPPTRAAGPGTGRAGARGLAARHLAGAGSAPVTPLTITFRPNPVLRTRLRSASQPLVVKPFSSPSLANRRVSMPSSRDCTLALLSSDPRHPPLPLDRVQDRAPVLPQRIGRRGAGRGAGVAAERHPVRSLRPALAGSAGGELARSAAAATPVRSG